MRTISSLFIMLIAGLSLNAFASPININLAPNTIVNGSYANQLNYTSGTTNLAVTGWSNGTITTKTCTQYKKNGSCKTWTNITSVDPKIEQSVMGKWVGLGVEQANSPNHAIDNEKGDYDMLLLSFNQIVSLMSLDIGWFQKDADVSVLAFTGTSFSGSLVGKTWASLLGDWSVVGNYDRNGTGSFAINNAGLTSQYWLVGAYNSAFGGNLSVNNDYFKLRGLSFELPVRKVSEPGSLLLLLVGLVGIASLRRRAH